MKKVVLSLLLVSLTALLSAELPYQLVNVLPDVAIFYIIFASSLVSIALAVFMYAKTFEDHVTIRPSVHFHPIHEIDIDPEIEKGVKEFAEAIKSTSGSFENFEKNLKRSHQVTRDGMIKKGDKLTPEHRAKISASLKKRAAEKKAQDERIQKTRASKVARKKSGK